MSFSLHVTQHRDLLKTKLRLLIDVPWNHRTPLNRMITVHHEGHDVSNRQLIHWFAQADIKEKY